MICRQTKWNGSDINTPWNIELPEFICLNYFIRTKQTKWKGSDINIEGLEFICLISRRRTNPSQDFLYCLGSKCKQAGDRRIISVQYGCDVSILSPKSRNHPKNFKKQKITFLFR